MPFTKFLGVLLGCYAVYYFFIILIDLIKSKNPAVATDRRSLHSVEYELQEKPNIQSQKVSKETHGDNNTSTVSANKIPENKNHPPEGEPAATTSLKQTEVEDKEDEPDDENTSSDRSPIDSFDLEEERQTIRGFGLEHEELSEGIEVIEGNFGRISEENFGKNISFV